MGKKMRNLGTQHPAILGILGVLRNTSSMTKEEVDLEALIYTELTNPEPLALSIKLPFNKNFRTHFKSNHDYKARSSNTLLREFLSRVATALRRTSNISAWFYAAYKIDVERYNQLGTLNYLPSELRQQIWVYVVENDRPGDPHKPHRRPRITYLNYNISGPINTQLTCYLYGHSAPTIIKNNSAVCKLRQVSVNAGLEIDPIFVTRCHFYFDAPRHLMRFLARLQFLERLNAGLTSRGSKSGFRFHIKLFNYKNKLEQDEHNKDWFTAIGKLPKNLRSISFDFGYRNYLCVKEGICESSEYHMRGAVYHMDVRRELDVLRTLKKQIRKIAPGVETYMLDSEGRSMKQRDRKAFEKVFKY